MRELTCLPRGRGEAGQNGAWRAEKLEEWSSPQPRRSGKAGREDQEFGLGCSELDMSWIQQF